jgi:hypothetical protein
LGAVHELGQFCTGFVERVVSFATQPVRYRPRQASGGVL